MWTLFSVVQTGERTTSRGTNSAPNIKRLCNGEYRPEQLYILSSRVAPDITDANVHALCTKPAVLKMKESGKSSRNHRTVRGRTETCRHQVNGLFDFHSVQWKSTDSPWVAQWVRKLEYLTTHTSLSPILHGFAPGLCKLQKGCTRLAAANAKAYQLLAHGR